MLWENLFSRYRSKGRNQVRKQDLDIGFEEDKRKSNKPAPNQQSKPVAQQIRNDNQTEQKKATTAEAHC